MLVASADAKCIVSFESLTLVMAAPFSAVLASNPCMCEAGLDDASLRKLLHDVVRDLLGVLAQRGEEDGLQPGLLGLHRRA